MALSPKSQIRTCFNCPLHTSSVTPVPYSGPTPSRIVVIGEAPGRIENELGTPFVGPAGTLARSWVKPHINPLDIAWINVVSCYPSRTPTAEEVTACAPNVELQLSTLSPDYVLVFGAVALSALCPIRSVTIGGLHGHFWTLPYGKNSSPKSAMAMATYHPAGVLRNRYLERDVDLDIETFFRVVDRELEPAPSHICVRCKEEPVEVIVARLGLGAKCEKFARPKVIQERLFEPVPGIEKHRAT